MTRGSAGVGAGRGRGGGVLQATTATLASTIITRHSGAGACGSWRNAHAPHRGPVDIAHRDIAT
eukprot:793333-Prymnesium_polylepis.1